MAGTSVDGSGSLVGSGSGSLVGSGSAAIRIIIVIVCAEFI